MKNPEDAADLITKICKEFAGEEGEAVSAFLPLFKAAHQLIQNYHVQDEAYEMAKLFYDYIKN